MSYLLKIVLLFGTVAMAAGQNVTTIPTTITPEASCNASYNPIPQINNLTRQTLTNFTAEHRHFAPLGTLLTNGFTFSPFTRLGSGAYCQGQNITTTATELSTLGDVLLKITQKWTKILNATHEEEEEDDPVENIRIFEINEITRRTMIRLGRRQYPALFPLTTNLWIGLLFNVFNQKGLGVYNSGQTVVETSVELKLLAKELIMLAEVWQSMAADLC